jgi:transposase
MGSLKKSQSNLKREEWYKTYQNSLDVLSTDFIDVEKLMSAKDFSFKFQKNKVINWLSVEFALEQPHFVCDLEYETVISKKHHEAQIQEIIKNMTVLQKTNLIKLGENVYCDYLDPKTTVKKIAKTFMKSDNPLPEFHGVLNTFGENKLQKSKLSKKIRKQQRSLKTITKKKILKTQKKAKKNLLLLVEKFTSNKKTSVLAKKYKMQPYKISRAIKDLDSGKLEQDLQKPVLYSPPKKLTEAHSRSLKAFIDNHHDAPVSLKDMQQHLFQQFPDLKSISLETIRLHIKNDLEYSYKRFYYKKKQSDNEDNKYYRFYVMKTLLKKFADDTLIISLDETGFNDDIMKKISWSQKGMVETSYASSLGENLSLTLAISQDGILGFTVRDGASNSFSFCYFMQNLVSYINSLAKYRYRQKIYILDNAAFHCSEVSSSVIQQLGIEVLSNAPYTPQLNPIEQSFHMLKNRVRKISTLSRFYMMPNPSILL